MITFLILAFATIHSPLAASWGGPILMAFYIGVGIVMVGFIGYKALRHQLPATPLDLPLILLMLVASVSSYQSIWPMGSQVRLITLIGYVAAFYFVYQYVPEQMLVSSIIRAGWILVPFYLALDIYRWMANPSLPNSVNVNVLAGILLIIMPFGLQIENRLWKQVWFMVSVAAIISTQSIGGISSGIVAMTILLNRDKRYLIVGGLSLIPFVIFKSYSVTIRLLCIWPTAIQAFLSHPLLGIGPAAFVQFCRCEIPAVPHAHNVFLTILAEMGIMGLAAFGLLLWQVWQHRRSGPAWAALCGFMVYSLVDDFTWYWSPCLGVISLLAIMVRQQNDHK